MNHIEILFRSFFRFFWVDLEKKCPFWDEEGKCFMEACSVCACDEKDLPFEWAKTADTETSDHSDEQSFGWISNEVHMDPLQNLGEVKTIATLDDGVDWIDMPERSDKSTGIFVNLAQNPER